jgi:hypothetical protein
MNKVKLGGTGLTVSEVGFGGIPEHDEERQAPSNKPQGATSVTTIGCHKEAAEFFRRGGDDGHNLHGSLPDLVGRAGPI